MCRPGSVLHDVAAPAKQCVLTTAEALCDANSQNACSEKKLAVDIAVHRRHVGRLPGMLICCTDPKLKV